MKIKKSQLREVFRQHGLSENFWDIFLSKKKKLQNKLNQVNKDIDDLINSAPTENERKRLKKLDNLLKNSSTLF